MDFDEYDYLEKAVDLSDPPKDSNGVGAKDSKRKSDEDRSKKIRVPEDGADRRERSESGRGERETPKDRERPSRDRSDRGREREKPDRDYRDRDRRERERSIRDNDREQERMGSWRGEGRGWGRGGRVRFYGRKRDFDVVHDGDRDRERENRPFDKEEEHGGPRYSREKKEKKEESAHSEPEADPERDQRTVFAFQISLKADERDVYDFFSKAGKVRDVRLIMDRNSRRSKGVGYIEFYDAMSVPMAIAMTGQLLLGQPVMVKPSEAEKNLVQSTTAATGAGGMMGPYSGGARRLYVGNLHYNITEDQLRQVFEPFGSVELVQLPTDPETGQCKGYGFVQYARLEDARSAESSLNGVLELAGRVIKVLAVTDQMNMQEPGVAFGELDDDEGGGMSLTARSRTLLMQKLDRSGTVTSIASSGSAPLAPVLGLLPSVQGTASTISPLVSGAVLGQAGIPGMVGLLNTGLGATASAVASIGVPTECLLLKNMFDPKTETDPDFEFDIKDEVELECSKFGAVKHIYVDKNSAGHVYVRFDILSSAMGAQQALHGRWFAGKMITVMFLTPQEYEVKFPESK